MIKYCLLFIFHLHISCSVGLSQTGDLKLVNNTYNPRVEKLFDSYSSKVGVSARIFNGQEYYYDDNTTGGNPYFMDMNLHDGLVIYEGNIYKDLDVGYDTFRDELFIVRVAFNGASARIKLPSEKVTGFQVSGRTFIWLQQDTVTSNPVSGYYELLYDGQLKVIAKRFKTIAPSDGLYRYEFSSSTKLYILLNNSYKQIRSKAAVRKLFKDKRRSIREYSRENEAYLLNLEDYLLLVARFYDQINDVSP